MEKHSEGIYKRESRSIANEEISNMPEKGESRMPLPFSFGRTIVQNKNMPEEVQTKMENTLGHDFSNVNIHKNSKSAVQMSALAYAQGNDIHFALNQYNPNSQKGQELLGHELTHVVQQREGRVKPTKKMTKGLNVNDDPALEREADVMGEKTAKANSVQQMKENKNIQKKSNPTIQRQEKISHEEEEEHTDMQNNGGAKGAMPKEEQELMNLPHEEEQEEVHENGDVQMKTVPGVTSGIIQGRFGRRLKRFGRRLRGFGRRVASRFRRIGRRIKGFGQRVWNGVKSVGQKVWGKLKGFYNKVKGFFNRLPSGLRDMISGLWTKVKEMKPRAVELWESVKEIRSWDSFVSWVKEIVARKNDV